MIPVHAVVEKNLKNVAAREEFVTSQYVPVGPLRHPVIFFNTAKTRR
jgi:hypothetical protein